MGRRYDDPLEFLLDGAAESLSDDERHRGGKVCTNLKPSQQLIAIWMKWGYLVDEVLGEFWKNNPQLVRRPLIDLLENEENVDYLVFMSLNGSGRSFTDGDWDAYLDDNAQRKLKLLLKMRLSKSTEVVEAAINDEAAEQCDRRARNSDRSLNGILRRR